MPVVVNVACLEGASEQITLFRLGEVSFVDKGLRVSGVEIDFSIIGLVLTDFNAVILRNHSQGVGHASLMKGDHRAAERLVGCSGNGGPRRRRKPRSVSEVNMKSPINRRCS